jgi:cation:H+ antiporter
MLLPILLLIVGLTILIAGAEFLVRGSSSIAKRFGISPLVIGLTIVAFGTSMPELIVNIFSAAEGATDLAIGNIVGSNIANIFLILGIAAIISPLRVGRGTVWKEVPFALLGAVLLFIMGNDFLIDGKGFNEMTRSDGFSLIGFFLIFLYYSFLISKSSRSKEEGEDIQTYGNAVAALFTIIGILALFLGGKLLVDNAIILATLAGLSEALIGVTIVAIGTSLPELVTSVVAVVRKHNDIAVGNVVGSNIFNVFWILGLTSTIHPLSFSAAINFDILVNVVATILLFAFMFIHTKRTINRWQGIVFFCLYAGYIAMAVIRG